MTIWCMSKAAIVVFCLRLMQPMRTRKRCWRSTSAVSPMVQWKPIKKGLVSGSKTKDLLWRGVWLIFNRAVAFYTKLIEQILNRFKVDKAKQIQTQFGFNSFTTLFINVLCQLRFYPQFFFNFGAHAPINNQSQSHEITPKTEIVQSKLKLTWIATETNSVK